MKDKVENPLEGTGKDPRRSLASQETLERFLGLGDQNIKVNMAEVEEIFAQEDLRIARIGGLPQRGMNLPRIPWAEISLLLLGSSGPLQREIFLGYRGNFYF